MIGKTNALANGISAKNKPNIDFDGKWSGWHVEFYDGKPYWEALFASSGTLTNYGKDCKCDAWGIGGGGAGGNYTNNYQGGVGTGGGSGYTNMVENITLPTKTTTVTIGAGATTLNPHSLNSSNEYYNGDQGGSTTFLSLTCAGGYGGCTSDRTSAGSGGSNGGGRYANGGSNGSPGAGKIMSKFWSIEHNYEYGAGGVRTGDYDSNKSGGGGGYLDVGSNGCAGHGYGAGGGGYQYEYAAPTTDHYGKSGCLIIRIPI